MISVKYRQACFAFLKRLWSGILNALPMVTWPSRVRSNVAPAAHETASASTPAAPGETVAEDPLAQAIGHLEYLGYETGPAAPDGWRYAQHPYRYDFHLRAFPNGIRLHCIVGIGAAIGNTRARWLEFLNSANDRGHIAQFSLIEDKAGICRVRMGAFISGAYTRQVFATVMDMWHDDLDLVRRKPEFLQASSAGEEEVVPAVTVN